MGAVRRHGAGIVGRIADCSACRISTRVDHSMVLLFSQGRSLQGDTGKRELLLGMLPVHVTPRLYSGNKRCKKQFFLFKNRTGANKKMSQPGNKKQAGQGAGTIFPCNSELGVAEKERGYDRFSLFRNLALTLREKSEQ